MTWRTGRKVGRTIYHQSGPEPSDNDPLIGVMDTPELAALAVDAVNRCMLPAELDHPGDICRRAMVLMEARIAALEVRLGSHIGAHRRGEKDAK